MPDVKGRVALAFPGQGVQRPGMGQDLHDRYRAARHALERAEDTLALPIRRLCFEGPEEELNRTDLLQPCVVAVSMAANEVWRELYGMEHVIACAGHSLGQFSALGAVGALPWEDVLRTVATRGRIMAEAASTRPGRMLAIVGLDEGEIIEIQAQAGALGGLWFANRNSQEQFVLSGATPAIEEAERLALQRGARRALILTIPLAAHSPLMSSAASAFRDVVAALPLRDPLLPLAGNGSGELLTTADAIRAELAGHLLRPVEWSATMATLERLRIETVVELGPGRVLASLAAKEIPGVETWNADELFIQFAEAPDLARALM